MAGIAFSCACKCVVSLYDSVLPNVCDSTAVTCSLCGGGVHNMLHFPGIFVKGDLIPIFYCK